MMRRIFFITTVLLTACGQNPKSDENSVIETANDTSIQSTPPTLLKADSITKIGRALEFINTYLDKDTVDIIAWVNSSRLTTLTTKSFRFELKKMVDEAYANEPEVGLDFDPILDAQDSPESFEVESFDAKTNYLTIKGKDWPEFKLTMKMISEDGSWLVDGCGVVNIPTEKRDPR